MCNFTVFLCYFTDPLLMWWLDVGAGEAFYSRMVRFPSFNESVPLSFDLHKCFSVILSSFFFFQFIYFEREREWVCMGVGAERERERESQAGSALSAWSPTWAFNSRTMRSWHELKSRVTCLTNWATQVASPSHLTCSEKAWVSWSWVFPFPQVT